MYQANELNRNELQVKVQFFPLYPRHTELRLTATSNRRRSQQVATWSPLIAVLRSHRNTDRNGLQCFCAVLEMRIVRLY